MPPKKQDTEEARKAKEAAELAKEEALKKRNRLVNDLCELFIVVWRDRTILFRQSMNRWQFEYVKESSWLSKIYAICQAQGSINRLSVDNIKATVEKLESETIAAIIQDMHLKLTAEKRETDPTALLSDDYEPKEVWETFIPFVTVLHKEYGRLLDPTAIEYVMMILDKFIIPLCLVDPYVPGKLFEYTIQWKKASDMDFLTEWIALFRSVGFTVSSIGEMSTVLGVDQRILDQQIVNFRAALEYGVDELNLVGATAEWYKKRLIGILQYLIPAFRSYFDYYKYEYVKRMWPLNVTKSPAEQKTDRLFNEVLEWLESGKGQIIQSANSAGTKSFGLVDTNRINLKELLIKLRDDVVGLPELKIKVLEIVRNRFKGIDVNFQIGWNFMFLGNPGTGKTEVTRGYISKIFSLLGVIQQPPPEVYKSVNERLKDFLARNKSESNPGEAPVEWIDPMIKPVIEVKKEDVIGLYEGWTPQIVLYRCAQAFGRVLFIDEAYNIAKDPRYGAEAMNALLTVVTEFGQYVSIIMGGYEKEMKQYIYGSNRGWQSRIPNVIKFENYTPAQLAKIFMLTMMSNRSSTRGLYAIDTTNQSMKDLESAGNAGRPSTRKTKSASEITRKTTKDEEGKKGVKRDRKKLKSEDEEPTETSEKEETDEKPPVSKNVIQDEVDNKREDRRVRDLKEQVEKGKHGRTKEQLDQIEVALTELFKANLTVFEDSNARGVQNILSSTIKMYHERVGLKSAEAAVIGSLLNGTDYYTGPSLPFKIPVALIEMAIKNEAAQSKEISRIVKEYKKENSCADGQGSGPTKRL